MMDRYQTLLDMRDNFNKDMPGIAEQNSNLSRISRAVLNEAVELFEAVVSGLSLEEIADEAADVFWFLVVIFKKINIDLFDAARNKHAYNLFRFGGYFKESGSYQKEYLAAKTVEKNYNLKGMYNDGCTPIRSQA